MRLWSLHPKYLDAKGLVALWREALLAQHVLLGKTKGYRRHPQLIRFRAHASPKKAIGAYLVHVWEEARARGYEFDRSKIRFRGAKIARLPVTGGQVEFEAAHLRKKLKKRDPKKLKTLPARPGLHPLFRKRKGPVEDWERV